jgi:uncharacterized damage-inducible protein DinB
MFTKAGIADLHGAMHERLDLLLGHVATVPDDLCHKPIPGFGHSSIWKQLVHILSCEEGWVHDLQDTALATSLEKDCLTITAMKAAKGRISEATRAYLSDLSEEQLNSSLLSTCQPSAEAHPLGEGLRLIRALARSMPPGCYPAQA